MKAFAYQVENDTPRIGIEIESGTYNFTQIWDYFKELKSFPKAPDLNFLQIMIELGYFSSQDIGQVIDTVKDMRGIDDIKISRAVSYDVPIARPQKILCIGRNYQAHADEWNSKVPEKPLFFSKLPSSLLAHEKRILVPPDVGRVDHEVELAVVIGKTASMVDEAEAMSCVAGYTVAIDVTARDMQQDDIKNGRPWTLAKGMDTFCPIGPFLVPADAIDDPHDLDLQLKVNGQVRQHDNTGQMIFKIPRLISYISQYVTFIPGDILLTGTPEGTLPLQPGDTIEASISHIGTLRVHVDRM